MHHIKASQLDPCWRLNGKRTPSTYGPKEASKKIKINLETSKTLTYHLYASGVNASSRLLTHKISDDGEYHTLRSLTLKSTIEKTNNTESVELDLSELRPIDNNKGLGTYFNNNTCESFNYNYIFSQPKISGHILVKYKMPKNSYLVKVTRTRAESLLSIENSKVNGFRGLKNALNRNLDKSVIKQTYYIWAKPGSTLIQDFEYREMKDDFSGHLKFKFEPIIAKDVKINTSSFRKFTKKLENLLMAVNTKVQIKPKDFHLIEEEFAEEMAGIVGNEENIQEIAKILSLKELSRFLNMLITLRDSNVNQAEFSTVKLGISIFTHQMTQALLADLLPLCESITIKLPYKDKKITTDMVRVASYLLKKAALRLENTTIKPFESLISNIYEYQKKGLSFSQIRNNMSEYEKILKSYYNVAGAIDVRQSPIKEAYNNIAYILDETNKLKIKNKDHEDILLKLEQAMELENNFTNELSDFIRLFSGTNTDPINISELKRGAENIERLVNKTIEELKSNRGVFAVSNNGVLFVYNFIASLGAHEIDPLIEPLKSDLEYFRRAFYDQKYLVKTSEKIKLCRLGVENETD